MTMEDYLALSPEQFPERVGRIRKKKGESAFAWHRRALRYLEVNPPKPKKPSSSQERFDATIQAAKTVFGLTDAEIADLQKPVEAFFIKTSAEARQRSLAPADHHNLWPVRLAMFRWVEKTVQRKVSEAWCNLDCPMCPSGQALNCAAQNASAAEQDSINMDVVKEYEHVDRQARSEGSVQHQGT